MNNLRADELEKLFATGCIPSGANFASLISSSLNLQDAGVTVDTCQRIGLGCTPAATTLAVQSQYVPIRGTISVGNGASAVTGVDTDFWADAPAGTTLQIAGAFYTVSSVQSAVMLTISPAFPAAPTPAVANGQAYRDSDNLLQLSNADRQQLLLLDRTGTLFAAGAIQAQSVTVGTTVTATQFAGSGAQLKDVPISALTGTFTAEQLPNLPATKISGVLRVAQIPSLSRREVLMYAPTPLLGSGQTGASVCWEADVAYALTLEFQFNGQTIKRSLGAQGTLYIPLTQSTIFTLTARLQGVVHAQRQITIDVAQN